MKEITKEGTKNGVWTLPFLMTLQEHMRHFCKDLPMIQYNPSRHHQRALRAHTKENSEEKYVETVKDEEMPQPKTSGRKRKASGISSTKAPPKYRSIVIESRVDMRNRMLQFLNTHHQAFNGNAPCELPNYLTEAETKAGAAGVRDDQEDQDVKTFGGDDL